MQAVLAGSKKAETTADTPIIIKTGTDPKFDAGIISERNYRVIAEQAKREDKDAGLV